MSDERREVAERLLVVAARPDVDGEVYVDDALAALGVAAGCYEGYVAAGSVVDLADLIDPTCEDVGDEAHFVCSSCGCRVDRWQGDLDLDPITPTVMEDGEGLVTPRFCPNFGARVVSGSE